MARVRTSLEKEGEPISKAVYFASFLLIVDSILVILIISFVPYTKIDWDAYMSQVDGFLGGERDYSKLEGDTGPLVYPAGFLYVYSALKFVTGGQVFPAQILFGILYILNLGIVLVIYTKTNLVWVIDTRVANADGQMVQPSTTRATAMQAEMMVTATRAALVAG